MFGGAFGPVVIHGVVPPPLPLPGRDTPTVTGPTAAQDDELIEQVEADFEMFCRTKDTRLSMLPASLHHAVIKVNGLHDIL